MMNERIETILQPCVPQFQDIGIIGLVPQEWGGVWMPRHHILFRLAKYFNVVWANPPLEWRRQWLSKRYRHRHVPQVRPIAPGFSTYTPGRWAPCFYKPTFLARLTQRQRLRQMREILRRLGAQKFILYLWRPNFASALDAIDHDASCYHIDDEYTFSEVELPVEKKEAILLQRVDQVFIHSPALMDKKGHYNPNSLFLPNGVNYPAYANTCNEPVDLQSIPHPRIGYVGKIKIQLDLEILFMLAKRHREWSFVFIGPDGFLGERKTMVDQLKTMPNVHFLGGRPMEELPAYTQHLDVCMLCYAVNDYTKFIYPLKLHEYLASGRPVVGSPIRSLVDFSKVIRLAQTADEWSSAIADSLEPTESSKRRVAERRRIAQQHDWEALARRVAGTLCTRLGPSYAHRFDKIYGGPQ